ncbi:YbaB/EbfC family nucleoid-associated protein [Mycobacterium sp. SP-6446]|uniref:YbaB/EbfC family nucleoid-associated protein n=1 Tax=Mycobacterium sp. SP-6446 TaxID=1834162 RepID=UPI00158D9661|nr:YbaB/EbfC family nucleoid-associated protein [Mycobacterium sp. SP-6446]
MLAGLQAQVADVAAVQKKQAALRVEGQAAEGTVEVSVNARGQLVNVVIDTSYLDDHDFDELAGHIVEAAQAAVREAGKRVAAMLAPINQRDKSFPTFSDIVEDIPGLRDVLPSGLDDFAAGAPWKKAHGVSVGGGDHNGDDGAGFPTVRRCAND